VEVHLGVNILGDLVEQEIENGVGFRFGDTEYATGNARVDVNALPASDVDTNDRVCFDGGQPREIPPLARPHCAGL
jgi:hypothetical protein